MAKSFKALLNEKKASMTDEEFFCSNTFIQHLNTLIEGVTERYKTKVFVKIVSTGNFVAYTDNRMITINCGFDWIKNQPTRVQKYYVIVGLVLHECGHILYTDFDLVKRTISDLQRGKISPTVEISKMFEDALKKGYGKKLVPLYDRFDNAVEDGHIERRIMSAIPGYGECLAKVREIHKAEEFPTYGEMIKSNTHIDKISLLHNMILFYAKFRINKLGKIDKPDEFSESFTEMTAIIDKAVETNSCIERKKEFNRLFDKIVKFILKTIKEQQQQQQSSSDKQDSKSSDQSEVDGSSGSSDADSKSDGSENSDAEKDENKKNADDSKDSNDNAKDSSADKQERGSSVKSGADNDDEQNSSVDSKSSSDKETPDSGSDMKDLADQFDKAIDELKNEDCIEDISEKVEHTGSSRPVGNWEKNDSAPDKTNEPSGTQKDIDLTYLEKIAAEEAAAKEIHNRIEKMMAEISDKTRRNRIDKCPSVEKYVNPDETAIADYEGQKNELDRISRRVVKNLDKLIHERQIGDVANGLYVGKQLDSNHAYRKDRKIMKNKILPEDIPDMEVSVLVDCSGSMGGGSKIMKILAARQCAYITWKFCKIMNIPISVYGHSTTYISKNRAQHVELTCVAHKECQDESDGQRIFMLRPSGSNRDGWALQFCAEELVRSNAKKKILFIISDGLPAAEGYGREIGRKDIRRVVKEFKKRGITFVAAGIDESADKIEDIYTRGVSAKEAAKFLNFTDIEGLPKTFAQILKKELQ